MSLRNCIDSKIAEYNKTAMDKKTVKIMVDQVVKDIEMMCNIIPICHGSIVEAFGSSVNDFSMGFSDIDTQINLAKNGEERAFYAVLKHLRKSKIFILEEYQRRAKVPVITVSHRNNFKCDITFTSPAVRRVEVIKNTQLLKQYTKTDEKVTTVFRFFKYILSKTPLLSTKTAGISSYGHTIMFLCYLRQKENYPFINIETLEIMQNDRIKSKNTTSQILRRYLKYLSDMIGTYEVIFDISKSNTITENERIDEYPIVMILDPYEKRNLAKQLSYNNMYYLKTACGLLFEKLSRGNWITTRNLKTFVNDLPLKVLLQAENQSDEDKNANNFVKKYKFKILKIK